MKRTILAAALLSASVSAAAQTSSCIPGDVVIHRETGTSSVCHAPPVPVLAFGDSAGRDFVTLSPSGVRLDGAATISFSPFMASSMSLHVGAQVAWVKVRVGDTLYAMPLYQIVEK